MRYRKTMPATREARLKRDVEKTQVEAVIVRSMELERTLVARIRDLEKRVSLLEEPLMMAAAR